MRSCLGADGHLPGCPGSQQWADCLSRCGGRLTVTQVGPSVLWCAQDRCGWEGHRALPLAGPIPQATPPTSGTGMTLAWSPDHDPTIDGCIACTLQPRCLFFRAASPKGARRGGRRGVVRCKRRNTLHMEDTKPTERHLCLARNRPCTKAISMGVAAATQGTYIRTERTLTRLMRP